MVKNGSISYHKDMASKWCRTCNPNRVAKAVGEGIKTMRLRLGLSQTELAERIGLVGNSRISLYERGDLEPSRTTFEKIQGVFAQAKLRKK